MGEYKGVITDGLKVKIQHTFNKWYNTHFQFLTFHQSQLFAGWLMSKIDYARRFQNEINY